MVDIGVVIDIQVNKYYTVVKYLRRPEDGSWQGYIFRCVYVDDQFALMKCEEGIFEKPIDFKLSDWEFKEVSDMYYLTKLGKPKPIKGGIGS